MTKLIKPHVIGSSTEIFIKAVESSMKIIGQKYSPEQIQAIYNSNNKQKIDDTASYVGKIIKDNPDAELLTDKAKRNLYALMVMWFVFTVPQFCASNNIPIDKLGVFDVFNLYSNIRLKEFYLFDVIEKYLPDLKIPEGQLDNVLDAVCGLDLRFHHISMGAPEVLTEKARAKIAKDLRIFGIRD